MAAEQSNAVILIGGPTASGKSAAAMELAEQIDGEIICADSQTVRRGLDIGTAKPSVADQRRVPHHLLDIIEPYEPFSVAEFKARAEEAITDIQSRGKTPTKCRLFCLFFGSGRLRSVISCCNFATESCSNSVASSPCRA